MTARVTFRVAAGHAPPNRAPRARAAFMVRFARTRAKFKGGDLNLTARLAAKALRRKVVGSGVLYLAIPRKGWRVLDHQTIQVGSDHPAELVTVKHVATGEVVVLVVANCMSVSTGNKHAASIMRNVIDLGADVILASECADFTAFILDRKGLYQWEQPGKLGSPESGALIAVRYARAAMTSTERRVGSRDTREGGGIRERSIVRGRVTLI